MKKLLSLLLLAPAFLHSSAPEPLIAETIIELTQALNHSALKPENAQSKKFFTTKINSVTEVIPRIKEVFGEPDSEDDWFFFDLHEALFVNVEFNPRLVEDKFVDLFKNLKAKKGGCSFKDPTGIPEQIRYFLPSKTANKLAKKLNDGYKKNVKASGIQFDLLPNHKAKEVAFQDSVLLYTKKNHKQGQGFRIHKGEMLERFLGEIDKSEWPRRIYFLDDGIGSSNHVRASCEKLGIECLCFYYPRMWTFKSVIALCPDFWPQVFIPVKALKNWLTNPLENEWKSKPAAS